MATEIGNANKLYISDTPGATAGTLEVGIVRDIQLPKSASEIDATTRADGGWKGKRAGLKEWSITFDCKKDPSDTAWGKMRTAFFAGSALGVSALNGSKGAQGVVGINGQVYVTEFADGEPLDDMVTTSVTMVGNGAPTWG